MVLGWHSFDRASRVPHWNDREGWWRQHERSLEAANTKALSGSGSAGAFESTKSFQQTLAEEAGLLKRAALYQPSAEAAPSRRRGNAGCG